MNTFWGGNILRDGTFNVKGTRSLVLKKGMFTKAGIWRRQKKPEPRLLSDCTWSSQCHDLRVKRCLWTNNPLGDSASLMEGNIQLKVRLGETGKYLITYVQGKKCSIFINPYTCTFTSYASSLYPLYTCHRRLGLKIGLNRNYISTKCSLIILKKNHYNRFSYSQTSPPPDGQQP